MSGRLLALGMIVVLLSKPFCYGQSYDSEEKVLSILDSLVQLRDSLNSTEVSQNVIERIKELPASTDSLNGLFNLQISRSFYDLKNYDSARRYLNKALSILQNTENELLLIQVYDRLGIVISDMGDNNLAIDYYQKALEIADSNPDKMAKSWASKINGNIGGIYYDFEDYQKALEYATRAEQINDEYDLDRPYGIFQMQMGLSNLGLGNLEKAEEQLLNSVRFFEENFNPLFLQYGYINVARVYLELNQLDEAEKSLQKTAALTDSISALAESATISVLRAEVEFKRNRFDKARQYALHSLDVSLFRKMKMKEMQAYEILYKIDSARGDFREAFSFRNSFIYLNDSIRSQDTRTKIAELETKYETEKKEQEIQLANAEIEEKERQQIFLIVIIALILIMALGGYVLISQRFRLKRQLLSEEISNLRLQLNAFLGQGGETLDLEIDKINEKLENELTEREFSILQLALSDKNNRQIAESAFVSVNTVKFHLKNIYDKLGVSNRKEAFEFIIKPTSD